MQTDKPIRAHDALWEVHRLKQEAEALLKEMNDRGATRALLLRAKDLRKRLKAQGSMIEASLAFEAGAAIAFRQRTGRDPVDGDLILPADDVRGGKFAAALQSQTGTC